MGHTALFCPNRLNADFGEIGSGRGIAGRTSLDGRSPEPGARAAGTTLGVALRGTMVFTSSAAKIADQCDTSYCARYGPPIKRDDRAHFRNQKPVEMAQ